MTTNTGQKIKFCKNISQEKSTEGDDDDEKYSHDYTGIKGVGKWAIKRGELIL